MKSLITVAVAVAAGAVGGTVVSDHAFHGSPYAVLIIGMAITLAVAAAAWAAFGGRENRIGVRDA